MSIKYSIDEVVKFAVEIEKEGASFYRLMAEKSRDKEIKELCIKMANEEDGHQKVYEELLRSLGPDQNEFLYGLENEYIAYLHSFIEKAVFDIDRLEQLVAKLIDENGFFDYAIKKEKDSIEFYQNMKELVSGDTTVIDRIIKEEELHIERLQSFKTL